MLKGQEDPDHLGGAGFVLMATKHRSVGTVGTQDTEVGQLIQENPDSVTLWDPVRLVPILFHLSVQGFLLCADSKSPKFQGYF